MARADNSAKVAFDEGHRGALHRDVGSGAHCYSDIGGGERGRVVDPVARHCNAAAFVFELRDLRGIVRARHLSRAVMRNIRQNLFFAFIFNAAGMPIAAGVLYPWFEILLSPIVAGAAMSLSSVTVIGNSLRLRGVKL
jgi:hypothetical protein